MDWIVYAESGRDHCHFALRKDRKGTPFTDEDTVIDTE
jgi:hypothetical protein